MYCTWSSHQSTLLASLCPPLSSLVAVLVSAPAWTSGPAGPTPFLLPTGGGAAAGPALFQQLPKGGAGRGRRAVPTDVPMGCVEVCTGECIHVHGKALRKSIQYQLIYSRDYRDQSTTCKTCSTCTLYMCRCEFTPFNTLTIYRHCNNQLVSTIVSRSTNQDQSPSPPTVMIKIRAPAPPQY